MVRAESARGVFIGPPISTKFRTSNGTSARTSRAPASCQTPNIRRARAPTDATTRLPAPRPASARSSTLWRRFRIDGQGAAQPISESRWILSRQRPRRAARCSHAPAARTVIRDPILRSSLGTLYDVGTVSPTSGKRLGEELDGIDTPTLKGLWQSAPYYHDGRAATLLEVLTKYNVGDRMGVTSNLTPTELEQLVEYLLELDDVPEPAAPVANEMAGEGCCSVANRDRRKTTRQENATMLILRRPRPWWPVWGSSSGVPCSSDSRRRPPTAVRHRPFEM